MWQWRPWNEDAWKRHLELIEMPGLGIHGSLKDWHNYSFEGGRMIFLNSVTCQEFEQEFTEKQTREIIFGNSLWENLSYIQFPLSGDSYASTT